MSNYYSQKKDYFDTKTLMIKVMACIYSNAKN